MRYQMKRVGMAENRKKMRLWRTWNSRGQRFDPAYLHQNRENLVFQQLFFVFTTFLERLNDCRIRCIQEVQKWLNQDEDRTDKPILL